MFYTIMSIQINYMIQSQVPSPLGMLLKICPVPEPDIDCAGSEWTCYGYFVIEISNTKLMQKWNIRK